MNKESGDKDEKNWGEEIENRKDEFRSLKEYAEKERNAVLKNLEEQVICPVCLLVPRTGRMPICRNGHTTCETCIRYNYVEILLV